MKKAFIKYNGKPKAVMSFMGKALKSGGDFEEVEYETLMSLKTNLRIGRLFDTGELEEKIEDVPDFAESEVKEEPKKKKE